MSSVTANRGSPLVVARATMQATCLLTVDGILDSTTYLSLRDTIIKSALDEPRAVIVDVTALVVPAESAWAVFTSARWHVGRWPDVPILLVCAHTVGRETIVRNGIVRYVPVYATCESAIAALNQAGWCKRRRVRAELPPTATSLREARRLVVECMTAWSRTELIPVAKVVVSALVENVLQHTDSGPCLRLETDGATVTIAVEDHSGAPAERRAPSTSCGPSGLEMLTALCRMWGNTPSSTGKTVWAVIGPENRL
jgi:hypothetical protein